MPVRLISRGVGWIDREKAEVQFEKLIGALDSVGLRTEVRDGANGNALIFVRVRSEQKLVGEVYRSRCVLLLLFFSRNCLFCGELMRRDGAESRTGFTALELLHRIRRRSAAWKGSP